MVLDSLDEYAEYGGVYHDLGGRGELLCGRALCRLCAACVRHARAGDFCRHNAISGVYQAMISGQVLYSTCWLGLDNLIVPVCPEGEVISGVIEVGGLLPVGKLQQVQHNIFATLAAIDDKENLPGFINALQGLEELPAVNVENLKAFLREAVFSSGALDPVKSETSHKIWQRQLKLSTLSASYDKMSESERRKRLLEASSRLVESIASKDSVDVRLQVDTVLGIASACCSEGVAAARACLLPALSLLEMNRVLSNGKWSKAVIDFSMWIDEMSDIEDFKDLCLWFENTVVCLLDASAIKKAGEELFSEKVLSYLHANLSSEIRLGQASKAVGASQSSIMHKLKMETGKTFSQHLNGIRVKEAKRLLTFTSLPLGEVSARCGFKDQSYFTKVFTRHVNIGPREFRNMLKV